MVEWETLLWVLFGVVMAVVVMTFAVMVMFVVMMIMRLPVGMCVPP